MKTPDTTIEHLFLRARQELGAEGLSADNCEAAVLLVRMAALALKPGTSLYPLPKWNGLRNQVAGWFEDNRCELMETLRHHGVAKASDAPILISEYRDRLAGLAADTLTSERLSPLTSVSLTPYPLSPAPDVILFAAYPHASHEFFPVMLDAFQAQLQSGSMTDVVAAHTNWLTPDGCVQRAVMYDVDRDLLVECPVALPQCPGKALLIAAGGNERAVHEHVASSLPAACRLLNSCGSAQSADDKWKAYLTWREAGIPAPETLLFPANSPPEWIHQALHDALSRWETLVLKPRYGTEGRGVRICTEHDSCLRYAVDILTEDDVIVQPYRNALRYGPDCRTCTIRLNVSAVSGSAVAESGYIHVSPHTGNVVASGGQGGGLRNLVRNALSLDTGSEYIQMPTDFITEACNGAQRAVQALVSDEESVLMGVDVVADTGEDGAVTVLVLEANPRPAGLAHSRFLTPEWETPGVPGVSVRIWGNQTQNT